MATSKSAATLNSNIFTPFHDTIKAPYTVSASASAVAVDAAVTSPVTSAATSATSVATTSNIIITTDNVTATTNATLINRAALVTTTSTARTTLVAPVATLAITPTAAVSAAAITLSAANSIDNIAKTSTAAIVIDTDAVTRAGSTVTVAAAAITTTSIKTTNSPLVSLNRNYFEIATTTTTTDASSITKLHQLLQRNSSTATTTTLTSISKSPFSASSFATIFSSTSSSAGVESTVADKFSIDSFKNITTINSVTYANHSKYKTDKSYINPLLSYCTNYSDLPIPSAIDSKTNGRNSSMFSEVFDNNVGTELESGALEDSNCSLTEGGFEKNCKICSSRLQSPRVLSCLHVFCETCLGKLILADVGDSAVSSISSTAGELMQQQTQATSKNQIECPVCKQVTPIGQNGVKSLICDYILTNILDVATIESEQLFCTSCKSKEKAISRCNDCANFLCGGCDKAHRFMRCFENHEVLKLEDLQKTSMDNGKPLTIHKPLYCTVHTSENLKYYCFNCQIPVCNDCLITEHKGNDHHYEVIGIAEISVRGDVENLMKEAKTKVQYCDDAAANLSTALTELQAQHDSAYDLIQDTFEKCRKVLEKCREQSLAELEKLHSERELKIMDLMQNIENTMGKIDNSCKFTNRVLEQANATEFLSMKKLIAAQFINLINVTPKCDINYSLTFDTKLDKFEQTAQEAFGKFRTESTPPSPKESTPPPTLPGMPPNMMNMNGRSSGMNCSNNSQGHIASSVTASSPISLPTSMQSSFDGDLSVLGNGFMMSNVLAPDSPPGGAGAGSGNCNNGAGGNANGNQHINHHQHQHQPQQQHQSHHHQNQHHHHLQQQLSTSSSHSGGSNSYHGGSGIGSMGSSAVAGNTLNNILNGSTTGLNGPLGNGNQMMSSSGLNGLIGGGGGPPNLNGLGSGGPGGNSCLNNTLNNGPGAGAVLGNSLGCDLNGLNNDPPPPGGYSSILEYNISRLASLTESNPDTLSDPLSGITGDQSIVSAAVSNAQNQPITLADLLNGDQRAFNNLQALAKLGLNGDFHTDMTGNQLLSSGPSPTGIDCLLSDYCLPTATSPNLQSLPPLNGPGSSGGAVGGPGSAGPGGPGIPNAPGVGNTTVVDIGNFHVSPPHGATNILTGRSKATPMQIRCKFGSLGTSRGHFNSPHGFCLGVNEEIIVADTNNHRIEVFDKCGNLNFYFGVPGKEEGQLWYPRKVAVMHTNGKFVVCDRGNERSRMQIFSKNGHFIRKIAIRYIDIVAGLAVTSKGHIVAVDSVSPTVFVISEDGELVRWFDCSDFMREPSDIAIRDNDFYVCDFKGHCVAVFQEDGSFRYRIGNEKVTCFPNGIDISNAGDILIGDSHGNRFHVACYSRNGVLQSEFECPHVKVSRCCGLKITSEGYIVTLAKNNHHVLVLNTLYVH